MCNFACNLKSASQKCHSVQTAELLYSCGQLCSGAPGPSCSHLTVFINSLKFSSKAADAKQCVNKVSPYVHTEVIQQEVVQYVCVCRQIGERAVVIECVESVCVVYLVKTFFSILMSEQTVPVTVKFTDLCFNTQTIQKQAGHNIQVLLTSC